MSTPPKDERAAGGRGDDRPGDGILVVIPVFNEALSMEKVIRGVRGALPGVDLVIVDDGSTDGTGGLARGEGEKVLTHPFNLGYGAALQTGFRYALREGYEFVVIMDGDGQHEPRALSDLAAAIRRDEADLIVGSRFLEETGYRPSSLRAVGMVLFRTLTGLFTGRKITDATSGFQALNRRTLELYVNGDYPADYPDADVLIMTHRAGLRIDEIPVMMYPNGKDGPSMHGGLRPVYYVAKMFLSIAAIVLRGKGAGAERQEEIP